MRSLEMIDLQEITGLDLELDESSCLLRFGKDINKVKPDTRTLDQMKEVLLDKDIKEPKELYYMYRGIQQQKDAEPINKNNLRFDITVIKPDKLGPEFMKTLGHYHVGMYPELYDVVFGEALCLLQKPDTNDEKKIEDAILVKASQGEKIVVLPGYGHILVNISDKLLVTANWVSTQFKSQYGAYKNAGGAVYFIVSKNNKMEFIANDFFKQIPSIKHVRPKDCITRFSLEKNKPLYSIINRDVRKLDFLNHPENYDFSDVFISAKSQNG